ncbi:ankyrin repeat protein [Poronia punctata]|nr:ankyrin repeat protein [Poronia punctata]
MGLALPTLPVAHNGLVNYIAKHPDKSMGNLMGPYRKFEAELRKVYAQGRDDPVLDDPFVNVLPLFTKDTPSIRTRARNLATEPQEEKDKYIMALTEEKRRPNGSPAVVETLKEFQHNFSVFSESSLSELDWSNVVAAGSSVVNCLLPVPDEDKKTKRALRHYYHEKFCPASDVDLFLYGLNEEQAIQKIKEIETSIRDAILSEVTVVRTKNAITICSQYPFRHVQIVLRVYKSVSEILSGFDIDCSGAAYDGKQVYVTPRALAAYITQINPIDLSRRSPSYENRLSKYSHRNFEVYWPELDRSRVDPTIFERSFQRTLGLARLLVLERLPTTSAREEYLKKRREERGRPQINKRYQHRLNGNIKDTHEDEVAEWVDESEVSSYNTFTIPYGQRFHAKKIEKLCYTRDLLLNAEWNQPKEREVYLHRHPAFFGRVDDVIGDCCGTCPKPQTPEEIEIAEKEGEIYVSGNLSFRMDDPGRQQIGSFNPLNDDDWTEMAYVGNTARLCQAIVDGDLEHVQDWLSQEGADPNTRDYTGRTPLHLAVISSTPSIVQCLVDHGARLIARIADGRTALHLAASRGSVEIVKILLQKSSSNEEEEAEKQSQRRKARRALAQEKNSEGDQDEDDEKDNDGNEDSEGELIEDSSSDDGVLSVATGSFIKVNNKDKDAENAPDAVPLDDNRDEPDFYKIDAVAWDSNCSALHLAIVGGHCDVVKLLCQEFGADPLLPVKLGDGSDYEPNSAILTLALALALPIEKAIRMSETLLSLGTTSSQADAHSVTAFHRYVQNGNMKLIDSLWENDKTGLKTAINHLAVTGRQYNAAVVSPLMTAIDQGNTILVLKLLDAGARPEIKFDDWLRNIKLVYEKSGWAAQSDEFKFRDTTAQPLVLAICSPQPEIAIEILARGANPNELNPKCHALIAPGSRFRSERGETALDMVRRLAAELRGYEGEEVQVVPRKISSCQEPQGTTEFLSQFPKGSYRHWLVSTDIDQTLKALRNNVENLKKEEARVNCPPGLAEKREAIKETLSQLEKVERALLERNAKTFEELHPDIKYTPSHYFPRPEVTRPADYTTRLGFRKRHISMDDRMDAYIDLFEAAWTGDLEKIKSLTLAPWGPETKEAPLVIAVSDLQRNNPFSLAFLRGHFDTAKAILEIAHAQYSPGGEGEKARFTLRSADNEDDSSERSDTDDDDSGSGPDILKEIIDDRFTIEDVGRVSTKVQSDVPAVELLGWRVKSTFVSDGDNVGDILVASNNLLEFAIMQDDDKRFKFLLDMLSRFPSLASETHSGGAGMYLFSYGMLEMGFRRAIELGRTHMLSKLIREFGSGIPLEDLVKKSGAKMEVKPRYYQGLTVYGKKRSDWARHGRNLATKPQSRPPPLLTAAYAGSLESVEWFLGDAPARHYREFGKSKIAREDPSLKHLNQSPGGFDRAIGTWLDNHNDLVIHCAVLGPLGEGTNKLIEYLTTVCPSSMEAKTGAGYTPLYLACLLGRVEFARTLIKAGADQSVKDKEYNNIIHACLANSPKQPHLEHMLSLFDPGLRASMFCQRNHLAYGGETPLHFWLKSTHKPAYSPRNRFFALQIGRTDDSEQVDKDKIEILKLLLSFSKGEGLEMLSGSGDTALHTAVAASRPEQTRALLEHNPELLNRENAVGRTPAEIAYDIFTNEKASGLESLDISARNLGNPTLVKKLPSLFDTGRKGAKEATWDVVQEYLPKTQGRRRLVSLNEANDVARRLGESSALRRDATTEQNSGDDAEEKGEGEESEVDFVSTLYQEVIGQSWKGESE